MSTITNINTIDENNFVNNDALIANTNGNNILSINSSLSSSSSSYSMHACNNLAKKDYDKENEYNIDAKDKDVKDTDSNMIFIRVSINDQNLQKVLKFSLDETVWNAKQRVLATLAKEVKDGLNYGFYMPPYQGRAGKFLDDCRQLKEYSLNGPIAQLEFKYKKRVYKFIKINQKELRALNVKSNYKRFLDLVRTNQVTKVNRFLEKGLDPNFHSDLGETPLTIAVSLADPRNIIMTLYNGGAHLDFRSRDTLTPMHKASIIGNDKALKTLLELGAFAEVKDCRMLTPLYYSIINSSSIQAVEYLLFNGSTIGVKDDNNWQEIHHACKLGLSQHLDHLIYYGADINSKNNSGSTPLHICAIHNQENCARILLFRGCNRYERNLANQTPYDSAIIASNLQLADLIKNHRDSDIVPIRERPFYNTKRRSIYVDSNYSICLNNKNINNTNNIGNYASINSNLINLNNNNSTDLHSPITKQANVIENYKSINNSNMSSMKSQSLPKLDDENMASDLNEKKNDNTKELDNNLNNGFYAVTPTSMLGISNNLSLAEEISSLSLPPPPPPFPNINSGSSSPTSRSRSISSDDHGFGSASLSQLSSSPNIKYSYPRKRLYPSIPNRTFLCIKPYKAIQPGEIDLHKGDIVELLSIGDSGFWEGRCNGNEGWFKANCVEEFSVSKDSFKNDSVIVKKKTLYDLLTQTDENAPRTVVLQRGKKGFGFVLRGAKTSDYKFEPSPEIPALQFLESVDKESNADKAGLKPYDFILEINGVDVKCKTHYDCVKLIKKTGDTLALKVLTAQNYKSNLNFSNFTNSTNLTSTSSNGMNNIYQSPSEVLNKSSPSNRSQSYYAASAISNLQDASLNSTLQSPFSQILNGDLNGYIDGTKSLPSKKKPLVPQRNPNTSLSYYINNRNNKVKNDCNKLTTNQQNINKLRSPSPNPNNENPTNQQHNLANSNDTLTHNVSPKAKSTFSLISNKNLNMNSLIKTVIKSNLNKSSIFNENNILEKTNKNVNIVEQSNHLNGEQLQHHLNHDQITYMNNILAQIDELDKTLAEYDTNNCNLKEYNLAELENNSGLLTINKKKIVANDANAASIRTRVPVRKPGLNNGEIFNVNSATNSQLTTLSSPIPPPLPPPPPPIQQQLTLQQKTYSVPNLYNISSTSSSSSSTTSLNQQQICIANANINISNNWSRQVPLPPAPPPPPPPPISQSNSENRGNPQNNKIINHSNHIYSTPTTISNNFNSNIIHSSASNDTLVQDQSIDDFNRTNIEIITYDYTTNDKNVNLFQNTNYETNNDFDQSDNDKNSKDLIVVTSHKIDQIIDYRNNNHTQNYEENKNLNQNSSSSSSSSLNSNINQTMSTFNNKNNSNNSNLGMIINKNTTNIISNTTSTSLSSSSSPLTPRQIKQRNSAKRNSIPRSVSSNPQQLNQQNLPMQNTKQQQILNSLTTQQQCDLLFLQTQKFETEFLQTTRDLFARYPNAKISISVLIASQKTSRQIEIDRTMFEFLCSFQNIKLQPETPIRTTSIQNNVDNMSSSTPISTNLANNVINSSISSTSPSSSSSSSYDTNENIKNERSDDLSEAIKKAAADHFVKRQMSAQLKQDASFFTTNNSVLTKKETRSFSVQSTIYGSYKGNDNNPNVKSELERAIENRLRKTNLAIQQQEKLEMDQKIQKEKNEQKISHTNVFVESSKQNGQEISAVAAAIEAAKLDNLNKRNVPRDPPPPLPPSVLNQMSKSNMNGSITDTPSKITKTDQISIPPAPPLPGHFISNPTVKQQSTAFIQLSNNSTTSFPPPPSPTQLHRLSKSSAASVNLNRSIATPPPPPPPPPDFFTPKSTTQTNVISNFKIDPKPKISEQPKLLNSVLSTPTSCNVKSIINIYQQSQMISDPRSSSDFGELIAKKAAEKRAKFQDLKPAGPNAVTFQPDGSKVFNKAYKSQLSLQNTINNSNQSSRLSEIVYQSTDTLISNSINNKEGKNVSNKRDFISSYCKNTNEKIENCVDSLLISNQNASSNSNNNDKLPDEDNKDEFSSAITNDMNVNRNESFINTAAKLLERAKHAKQQVNSCKTDQSTHAEENKEYSTKIKVNPASVPTNTSQQSINNTMNILSIN